MNRAELLIDRLRRGPGGREAGRVANDLLGEFWRGYPLEALRKLLHDSDERVVGSAAFILSELGEKGRPLVGELPRLLEYPVTQVRMDAVESAICATEGTAEDAAVVAAAVARVEDAEPGVRAVACFFCLRASEGKLRAGLRYLEGTEAGSVRTSGLGWLLGAGGRDGVEVVARLGSECRAWRHYAVSAAVRMAGEDRGPLERAAGAGDGEVREDARRAGRLLEILVRHGRVGPGGKEGA